MSHKGDQTLSNTGGVTVTEPIGKFLNDTVAARLKEQAADVSTLTGRAKDLLGVATITTTITGVLANDKLLKLGDKDAIAPVVFAALVVALAAVIAGALYALKPRDWYFSPSPAEVFNFLNDGRLEWTVDQHLAAQARSFTLPGIVDPTRSAIEINDSQIRVLRGVVLLQMIGVSMLAALGAIMAYQATW